MLGVLHVFKTKIRSGGFLVVCCEVRVLTIKFAGTGAYIFGIQIHFSSPEHFQFDFMLQECTHNQLRDGAIFFVHLVILKTSTSPRNLRHPQYVAAELLLYDRFLLVELMP